MKARLYHNFEAKALIPHSTEWPAGLLVLVGGLDSVNLDTARHAVDITFRDPVGASN
jgi:hypothetical protein